MLRPFGSVGSSVTASHSNCSTHHQTHRRLDYGVNDIEGELNGNIFFEENSSLAGTGDGRRLLNSFIAYDLNKYLENRYIVSLFSFQLSR